MRDEGLLIDIHPEPESSSLELRFPGRTVLAGRASDRRHNEDILATRASRQSLVEAGYFTIEEEQTFETLSHFDTFEEWLTYREERRLKGAYVAPEELVERARSLFSAGAEALQVRVAAYAARLRRRRPPAPAVKRSPTSTVQETSSSEAGATHKDVPTSGTATG